MKRLALSSIGAFLLLFLLPALVTFAQPVPGGLGLGRGNGFLHGYGHPHFALDETTASVNADGSLSVSFVEAGLGHVSLPTTYSVSANGEAVYDCVDDVTGAIVATSGPIFASSGAMVTSSIHNGANELSVVLAAPGPGAFACPAGSTLVLASVSYSDVVIVDTLRGIDVVLPGPFAVAFI